MQTHQWCIRINMLSFWKMFTEENTVNLVQEHNHNNDAKVEQEKLL